jgi:hypothetical protein
MLSVESLRGEITVSNHKITMRYGTGTCPTGVANGAELTKQDATTTDLEKAFYANHQKRSFYELDQDISNANVAVLDKALSAYLKNHVR